MKYVGFTEKKGLKIVMEYCELKSVESFVQQFTVKKDIELFCRIPSFFLVQMYVRLNLTLFLGFLMLVKEWHT